jgi:hypothetical protein
VGSSAGHFPALQRDRWQVKIASMFLKHVMVESTPEDKHLNNVAIKYSFQSSV